MKTIKELDAKEKDTEEIGYCWALKDILKSIDKCPYLDNDGNVLAFKKELKKIIKG